MIDKIDKEKIQPLNEKCYTELPIDELDERLSMEELEDKLELACWGGCEWCFCTGIGFC